jgi:hypothetical protein
VGNGALLRRAYLIRNFTGMMGALRRYDSVASLLARADEVIE